MNELTQRQNRDKIALILLALSDSEQGLSSKNEQKYKKELDLLERKRASLIKDKQELTSKVKKLSKNRIDLIEDKQDLSKQVKILSKKISSFGFFKKIWLKINK